MFELEPDREKEKVADNFMPISCPSCGAIVDCYQIGDNIEGFCHICGEKISYKLIKIKCPACGKENNKWVDFSSGPDYISFTCKYCNIDFSIAGSIIKEFA